MSPLGAKDNVAVWHETDMACVAGDVRFRGKIESVPPTVKTTRLTRRGHWVAWTCAQKGLSQRDF